MRVEGPQGSHGLIEYGGGGDLHYNVSQPSNTQRLDVNEVTETMETIAQGGNNANTLSIQLRLHTHVYCQYVKIAHNESFTLNIRNTHLLVL